jgi:hypothetical protein
MVMRLASHRVFSDRYTRIHRAEGGQNGRIPLCYAPQLACQVSRVSAQNAHLYEQASNLMIDDGSNSRWEAWHSGQQAS